MNVKIPNLDTATPDDVKKVIDNVVADPAVASAVESKTVKLGMSRDEVKTTLGDPGKIVDLGAKQIFIYPDMKVILVDGKVSVVRCPMAVSPHANRRAGPVMLCFHHEVTRMLFAVAAHVPSLNHAENNLRGG